MSPAELAERLRAAHPEVDPLDTPSDAINAWSLEAGADPGDPGLLPAAIAAWAELVA